MRDITVTLYKFSELPTESAKENARNWWKELEAQEFGSFGELFEPAETAAKILGITFAQQAHTLYGGGTRYESDIRYSGFHVQGSGASFVGSYEYAKGSHKAIRSEFGQDAKLWAIADGLKALQAKHGYKLKADMTQSGNYAHEYTMAVDVSLGDTPIDAIEANAGDAVKLVNAATELGELMRDFARWIYAGLEAEYEYRLSDESADESMDGNEYEFTENGKIVPGSK